jgi:hypothetical protein
MSERMNDPGPATKTVTTAAVSGAVGSDASAKEATPAATRWGRSFSPSRPRQTTVVLRRVGPWSVLRFSLLFYFCVMLVVVLAFGMLYAVLGAVGAVDSITRLIRDLFGDQTFAIHGGWIFARLTLIGLVMVVVWSLVNVVVAFLYNLISDVVGGVEVTLSERQ